MNLALETTPRWSRVSYAPDAGIPNERIELTLHEDGRLEYRFYGKYRDGMVDRFGLAAHHELGKDGGVRF